MRLRQIILIVFTVLILSIGQILFKHASGKINIQTNGIFYGLLFNSSLLLGIAFYGIATFTWLLVLKTTPLKMAYPFAAIAFILVPILAFLFLGESLRWTNFIGALVIIVGVYISLL